jgi:tRNA (mo5U34)-methyltransferase
MRVTLQSHGAALGEDRLAQEIRALGPWFHNLHLPGGRQTAPDHPLGDFPAFKWEQLAGYLPEDMSGLSVLDIGCNAGFYSLRLAERGARVLAVDVDQHYLRQARWARERFGFGERQIALRRMQVYELARLQETFDLVLFMGVLYHLRYPLLALDIVAGKVRERLILQTLTMPGDEVLQVPQDLPIDARAAMRRPGWPLMAFIEHALAGDPTNWWAPNQACVEAMLRSAGLEPRERPAHEIVIAHRTASRQMPGELRAILGAARSPTAEGPGC